MKLLIKDAEKSLKNVNAIDLTRRQGKENV